MQLGSDIKIHFQFGVNNYKLAFETALATISPNLLVITL